MIFPLSLPGVAVAAMLVWLESWNEFTYALYLTVSENTLPLQTYYYLNRGGIFNSAAYATIITLPVIVLTFILQRYITSGMLAGGGEVTEGHAHGTGDLAEGQKSLCQRL